MLHDVTDAVYKGDYLIEIGFDDGTRGIVDFSTYPSMGGLFRKFKDMNFFRGFKVSRDLGTLVWSDEVDVAPETLYEEALKSKPTRKNKSST
ncbi:DUF2442 domain-containing protein [bacterium]|nr:DUF2442 domain-containing protein [bacterium]